MKKQTAGSSCGIGPGHIAATVQDDVAVITLQRPEKLNALTAAMRRDLAGLLRHFGSGDLARGIVITGAGRAFSAGEDLREAAAAPGGGLLAEVKLFHDITRAALETRVPVIAALNGMAVGGACEMAVSFDARIGTPATEYFLPENDMGLCISNGASMLLPRLAGRKALRLVLESARISAQAALSLGLLDEIVEPADLLPSAIRLVHRWTRPGAATVAHLKLLRPSLSAIERAIEAETEAAIYVEAAGLAQEGISKFLGRRT